MEIIFIGNPFGNGESDINSSCKVKTCTSNICASLDCTKELKCEENTCGQNKSSYDDEYWD